MKERINRLARGRMDDDEVQVSFSVDRIEESVVFDDKIRGEFRLSSGTEKVVKGLAYSTNLRVTLLSDNFMGKDVRIAYEVDTSYAEGEIKGEFQLVCSGGEFTIPYCFHVCASDPDGYQIRTLREFAGLARENPEEALKFFESPDFIRCPFMKEAPLCALYDGLWGRGNRQNSMEEFLVASGVKKPVRFSVKEKEKVYEQVLSPVTDHVTIKRSTAGYLCLSVSSDADFIRLEKTTVNSGDFSGDTGLLEYTILPERLHAGKNWGEIRIKGVRGEETVKIHVAARSNRIFPDGISCKKDFSRFVSLNLQKESEEYEKNFLLNSMQTTLSRVHAVSEEPALVRLYQADVFLQQGKREQARQMMEETREAILDNRDRDVSAYCYYMFLKVRESGETVQKQTMVKLLKKYYEEGVASDMAFYVLMQTDPELLENDSLALSRLKAHYRSGCRSPYLYLAVCRILKKSPELLRVMEDFEIHSLWFGVKHHLVPERLAKAAAVQAIQAKRGRRLCLRLLKKLYEEYPCRELLTGICALLIRGDCRDRKAFDWYAKGVEEDIHLTRLYEYYLYALPEDYEGVLPKVLLLYFSYNHTLDYHAQAALYLNVLTYLEDDEEIYRAYESQIENFAVEQLFQSHMNRALARIYSQTIFPEMVDEKIAGVLPRLLYAREITCKKPGMQQVILCYEQMQGETAAILRNGKAYVPVYMKDVHVLFQDDYGNRYGDIPYTAEAMMDCPKLEEKTEELNPSHEMLRLRECCQILEKKDYSGRDIEILKNFSVEENIHGLFRKRLISELVAYYYRMSETAACDEYLLGLDKRLLDGEGRLKVMDVLVTKDFYEEAYKMASRYGYRSLGISRIFKLTSKMILKALFEKNTLLLEMAYYCFERGRFDDVIVEYLCCYYNGLSPAMYRILEAGRKGRVNRYDLPERLLAQMLFDGMYDHMDDVFRQYIAGKTVDESLVRAYLVVKSSLYFDREEPLDEDILGYIEAQAGRFESGSGLPEICMLALTKHYSERENLSEKQISLCQEIIDALYRKRIIFAYYKKLARFITLPGDFAGKTVIEYHGKKSQNIWIHYYLLPDGGEKVVENIPHMFNGYFVKLVSLFYGETLKYEIHDGSDSENAVMTGSVSYEDKGRNSGKDRAACLDELLKCRETEESGFREKMERYAVRDEMTEKLFNYM